MPTRTGDARRGRQARCSLSAVLGRWEEEGRWPRGSPMRSALAFLGWAMRSPLACHAQWAHDHARCPRPGVRCPGRGVPGCHPRVRDPVNYLHSLPHTLQPWAGRVRHILEPSGQCERRSSERSEASDRRDREFQIQPHQRQTSTPHVGDEISFVTFQTSSKRGRLWGSF